MKTRSVISLLYVFCILILLLAVSTAIAEDTSYICEVLHTYDLERDGSVGISGFDKQFRGSKFTVSKKDGQVVGYVVPTKLAKSTNVIQAGNTKYSFRAIADFGRDIQILDIREFVPGKQKPFVATAFSGAGIVSGVCE